MAIEFRESTFKAGTMRTVQTVKLENDATLTLIPHKGAGKLPDIATAANIPVHLRIVSAEEVAVTRLDKTGNPIGDPEHFRFGAINQQDLCVNPQPGTVHRVVYEGITPDDLIGQKKITAEQIS